MLHPEQLDMCINFGFAGFQTATIQPDVYKKIDALLNEFIVCAQVYNNETFGFSGNEIKKNFYSTELLVTNEIRNYAVKNNIPLSVISSIHEPAKNTKESDIVISLDIHKTNLSYPNITSEYMVNESDVLFLLWDGTQDLQEGILWVILQLCKQKHIPYYLINTANLDNVSFTFDSYYNPYSKELVSTYVAELFDYTMPSQEREQKLFLSKVWLFFYNRFIRRHKMRVANVPYEEDRILDADYFDPSDPRAENHKKLAEYFRYYDQKAIDSSTIFRAAIYFRSILPFLAMIFIAIGSYTETVFTFFFGESHVLGFNTWIAIAGIGFLMHSLINLYADHTSKNKRLQKLRNTFTEARFIAEYLRVIIHAEAFGVQLNNANTYNISIDRHVSAKLHHILRQQAPVSYVQNKDTMNEAIQNIQALVMDQKTYHTNSVLRYEEITKSLRKTATALFAVSFSLVVLRSAIQFALPYLTVWLKLDIQEVHGIKILDFSKSLMNMFALVIPAWASYCSTKLNMNNFAWLWENSKRMYSGYDEILNKLNTIKSMNNNSCQMLNDISNDIVQLSQEDCINWYLRTGAQSFTRL